MGRRGQRRIRTAAAVPVTDLQVAEVDSGEGGYAIYLLRRHQ